MFENYKNKVLYLNESFWKRCESLHGSHGSDLICHYGRQVIELETRFQKLVVKEKGKTIGVAGSGDAIYISDESIEVLELQSGIVHETMSSTQLRKNLSAALDGVNKHNSIFTITRQTEPSCILLSEELFNKLTFT